MKGYKFLEDVALADIAYEAYGKDLNQLFENAAAAIFELSADIRTIDPKKKFEIRLRHEKIDGLLYDFLSEILFIKDAKYSVFKDAKVSIKEGKMYELSAVLEGDTINPDTQRLENDIKAVTMHLFEVKKEKHFWKATIVVDI